MSVSDRDINATALIVIRRHGGSAGYFAARRADALLSAGDLEGATVWRRVLNAIEELLATEPKGPVN
jgi:hypothetical protein